MHTMDFCDSVQPCSSALIRNNEKQLKHYRAMEDRKSLVSKHSGTMRYEHKDGIWDRFIGEICYLCRNTSSVLEILA